ncbi:S-adenosyl-L-methionine-dependent methyltransferase, partial [Aureobasidium melanogenum]
MSILKREPAKVVVTDFTQGMIDNIQARIDQEQWRNITASVMDSHELSFPDGTFTLAICNVSTSTFKDPLKSMQEILRTLQPGGVCINSQWKRFTVKDIIHKAQISIRPDSRLFNMPRAEFLNDGVLRDLMLEAVFAKTDQYVETTMVTDDAIEGLREFECAHIFLRRGAKRTISARSWAAQDWIEKDVLSKSKTYSSRDSHVVTHRSTNLPFNCLCMAERTGCPVFS